MTARELHIFLLAGEPSGDRLGARLMRALAAETGGRVRFTGVGGEAMTAAGLDSLFDMRALSVMGLAEVVPHLRQIARRLDAVVAAVREQRPDAVVTIDSPSFALRVQRRLAGSGIPRIHYVAPQVWAWKPWRARRLARDVDHLLTLLPFEPPLFTRHGLAATFVGHPAVEAPRATPNTVRAVRSDLAIPRAAPVLCVLPGSRQGEVARMLPVFAETVAALARDIPGLHVVLPTLTGLAPVIERDTAAWPVPVRVLCGPDATASAFACAQAALAASGTVALELAVAGVPAIVAYRVHPATAAVVRRLIRVRHVSLPNIVLDRTVQPEYLQDACRRDLLAPALTTLLRDPDARARHAAEGTAAARALGLDDATPPSTRAARAVLATLESGVSPRASPV